MNIFFGYIGVISFLIVIAYAINVLIVRYLRKSMPSKRRKNKYLNKSTDGRIMDTITISDWNC